MRIAARHSRVSCQRVIRLLACHLVVARGARRVIEPAAVQIILQQSVKYVLSVLAELRIRRRVNPQRAQRNERLRRRLRRGSDRAARKLLIFQIGKAQRDRVRSVPVVLPIGCQRREGHRRGVKVAVSRRICPAAVRILLVNKALYQRFRRALQLCISGRIRRLCVHRQKRKRGRVIALFRDPRGIFQRREQIIARKAPCVIAERRHRQRHTRVLCGSRVAVSPDLAAGVDIAFDKRLERLDIVLHVAAIEPLASGKAEHHPLSADRARRPLALQHQVEQLCSRLAVGCFPVDAGRKVPERLFRALERLVVRDLRLFFIGQAVIRASRRVDGGPAQPCHLADRIDQLHHIRRRVDHAGFERVVVRIVEHDFVSVPNDLLVYRLVGMNAIERVHPTGVCAVASLGKRRRGAALDRSRHRADIPRVALPAIRRVLLRNERCFDHIQHRRARRNRHAGLFDPRR